MQINTLKYNHFGGYIINGNIFTPLTGSRYDDDIAAWLALGNMPEAVDAELPPDAAQLSLTGARQWFIDNPNTQQLFTLSIPDLEAEINTLVDALFPLATAQNRTKTKKFWMALAVSVRFLVKRELQ